MVTTATTATTAATTSIDVLLRLLLLLPSPLLLLLVVMILTMNNNNYVIHQHQHPQRKHINTIDPTVEPLWFFLFKLLTVERASENNENYGVEQGTLCCTFFKQPKLAQQVFFCFVFVFLPSRSLSGVYSSIIIHISHSLIHTSFHHTMFV